MIVFGGLLLALVIIVVVFWLLLTRRLREKYAALWLVIGFAVLILGLFPQLVLWFTDILGVQLPVNLLFSVAIVLLLCVALHLSWELSQAEEEVRRIAEEAAISRADFDLLAARVTALEESMGRPDVPLSGSNKSADSAAIAELD